MDGFQLAILIIIFIICNISCTMYHTIWRFLCQGTKKNPPQLKPGKNDQH